MGIYQKHVVFDQNIWFFVQNMWFYQKHMPAAKMAKKSAGRSGPHDLWAAPRSRNLDLKQDNGEASKQADSRRCIISSHHLRSCCLKLKYLEM